MKRTRPIRTRRLGRTDLVVSEFGLGCARIGGVFKQGPDTFLELLAMAFDAGITFFDTADMYSQGESEKLLGRAFRGKRDRVVLASKAGYVLPAQRRFVARLKPIVRPIIRLFGLSRAALPASVRGEVTQNFTPAYLTRAVEASLRRLGTDYLDLLQLHSPPASVVEAGDWVTTLERLQRDGKIRYYGVACDSVDVAAAALRHANVASIQITLNLLNHDALQLLPQARERGVGIIARECLANGLLVKDLSTLDMSAYVKSDAEGHDKATRIRRYQAVADEHGLTLPDLALAFVRAVDGVSVSLVGVSRVAQLERLLAQALPPSAEAAAVAGPFLR